MSEPFKTKRAAKEAASAMMPLLPDHGKGYQLLIWENLDWHFKLKNGRVTITDFYGGRYYCSILNSHDALSGSEGAAPHSAVAKTPKAALRKAIKAMKLYATSRANYYAELWSELNKVSLK